MQYFKYNLYAIFYKSYIFSSCKFCLLPFSYNLISVLCSYASFFQKRSICFCVFNHNLILLLTHFPLKIRAANIINGATMPSTLMNIGWFNFCFQSNINFEPILSHQRWNNAILPTLFQHCFINFGTTSMNIRWLHIYFQSNNSAD